MITIYISHNVSGDFFLHRLDKAIREQWRDTESIKFDRNKLLPIDTGFIYDVGKVHRFRIRKGTFEFSEVSADDLRVALVRHELNASAIIKPVKGN
jgi:hypothetical protein